MSQPIKRVFPKLASSRNVPDEVKAIMGKLARDPHGNTKSSSNIKIPDQRVLGHIANKTISNINDARNLFQVLPDMDYARQIVISATISPGDLTDSNVIYSCKNEDLDTNLTGPMLRALETFFDETYRIRKLLPEILNDVLFEKGSYPLLIMPESSIDQIINSDNYKQSSMESAMVSLESHLSQEVGADGIYTPYGALGFPTAKGASLESMTTDGSYAKHSYVGFASFESFDKENPGRKATCEALNVIAKKHDKNFIVTDNPNILKRPMVLEAKRKIAIRRIYGGKLRGSLKRQSMGKPNTQPGNKNNGIVRYDGNSVKVSNEANAPVTEAQKMTTLNEVESAFYSQRRYRHVPVQPVLTKSQVGAETYGHPLVMNLPAESVVPIHVPGNPAEHVAYFVLLDINGNPLNVTSHDNYYDDIRNQLNSNDQFSTQVLQTVRRGYEGLGGINNEIIDEMTRMHADAIEADWLSRLRSGVMEGDYKVTRTQYINQVMFSRHLKGQKTIMLYVPADMLTYVAFDYNEYGVGKSLLEDAKILGSIRAALMLSNTLASINNATGGKTISIKLDPKDENPAETVEFMLSEYAKVNSEGYSRIIGQTHPLGLADQIQNHGVNIVVEGNSRYPETQFDVSRRDGTSTTIDTELEKTMRDRHFQVFGLSSEMADGINQSDFATTVVQNNLMLLKRVVRNQEKLEPFLTDIVRGYTLNSGILLDELRQICKDNKKFLPKGERGAEGIDDFIYEFIMSVTAELPSPEINDIQKQVEVYNQYSEGLEKIIDAYMSEEMFITDASLEMETIMPAVKKNVMAEFQRRFLRSRAIMPELDIFNSVDEEESPVFNFMEINQNHMAGLTGSLMKYLKAALKASKKKLAEKEAINKLKEEVAALPSVDDGMSTDDGMGLDGEGMDGGDLGDGSMDMGDDGMGGDLDMGMGDDGLGGDAGDGTDDALAGLDDAGGTDDGGGADDALAGLDDAGGGDAGDGDGADALADLDLDAPADTDAEAGGSADDVVDLDADATGAEADAADAGADGADGAADAAADDLTEGLDELEDGAAGTEGEEEEEELEEEEEVDPEDVDHDSIDIPNPNDKTGIDVPKAPKP